MRQILITARSGTHTWPYLTRHLSASRQAKDICMSYLATPAVEVGGGGANAPRSRQWPALNMPLYSSVSRRTSSSWARSRTARPSHGRLRRPARSRRSTLGSHRTRILRAVFCRSRSPACGSARGQRSVKIGSSAMLRLDVACCAVDERMMGTTASCFHTGTRHEHCPASPTSPSAAFGSVALF